MQVYLRLIDGKDAGSASRQQLNGDNRQRPQPVRLRGERGAYAVAIELQIEITKRLTSGRAGQIDYDFILVDRLGEQPAQLTGEVLAKRRQSGRRLERVTEVFQLILDGLRFGWVESDRP